MESLERFQQNQRIIDDFTLRTLAAIPSQFGRLIHVATLRDLGSGRYSHAGLEAVFQERGVHPALYYCHEEIFQKILETPLEKQELDLRSCLAGMEGELTEVAANWMELEFYRLLMPLGTPEYMRDLFCSNLRILLELFVAEQVSVALAA
ncbi:MAG: hypothetical protein WA755_00700 [Candidatus Acidiferrales bacterium]